MTFIDTNHLEVKEPRAGWKGRFFHSNNMTFAYYAVAAGAWIHEHSHPTMKCGTSSRASLRSKSPLRLWSLVLDMPWSFLQTPPTP
jgi:hypothetical protein